MTAGPAESAFLEHFAALEAGLPGHGLPWLEDLRREASASFRELGIPTTRLEDWRFTPLTTLAKTPFQPAQGAREISPAAIESHTRVIGSAPRVVFVNGAYVPALSSVGELPPGVCISSLASALAREPERIEPHLSRCADHKTRAFTALNTALASDGLFLELAPGAVLAEPLHVLFVQTGEDPPIAAHLRNLVVAGPGSRALLVEHYIGSAQGVYLTNAVTEIIAGRDSRLEHIKLQQESENAYHIVTGSGTDPTAILDGFTITGGNSGGGISNGGTLTLTNCIVNGNNAGPGGGKRITPRNRRRNAWSMFSSWFVVRIASPRYCSSRCSR